MPCLHASRRRINRLPPRHARQTAAHIYFCARPKYYRGSITPRRRRRRRERFGKMNDVAPGHSRFQSRYRSPSPHTCRARALAFLLDARQLKRARSPDGRYAVILRVARRRRPSIIHAFRRLPICDIDRSDFPDYFQARPFMLRHATSLLLKLPPTMPRCSRDFMRAMTLTPLSLLYHFLAGSAHI